MTPDHRLTQSIAELREVLNFGASPDDPNFPHAKLHDIQETLIQSVISKLQSLSLESEASPPPASNMLSALSDWFDQASPYTKD